MNIAPPRLRLADRVCIVTGAGGGIGLAIASRLAAEGAKVVVADRNEDKAKTIAKQLLEIGAPAALGAGCDVSDEAAVAQCCQTTMDRFGSLDVVVNNAGVMTFKPIEDLSRADWLEVLEVDLFGAFYFTKQAFRRMQPGGSIVNVASIHALMTTPNVTPYAASKAALLSLTRSSSIEGKARGLRANAVLPGAIDTPMLWENPNVKSGAETVEPGDVGSPAEIAAAVAFLASEDAAFITGSCLTVDGGRLAKL